MKIVVLGGGLSTERQVSLVTATNVCKALRKLGHQAVFVDTFFGLEDFPGKPEEVLGSVGSNSGTGYLSSEEIQKV